MISKLEKPKQIIETSPKNTAVLTWTAVLLCILGLLFLLPITSWMTETIIWFQTNTWMGPVVFAVLYIVSALLLVPSTILTLAAGSIWGWLWGGILLHIISVIADFLAFLIAKKYLYQWIENRYSARFGKRLERIDRALIKDGFYLAVLIRWFPILPTNLINYLLGLTSISTKDYFWSTALATIPNSFAFVYLGALTTETSRASIGSDPLLLIMGFFLSTLSIAGLMLYARKEIKRHHSAVYQESQDDITQDQSSAYHWEIFDDINELPERVWQLDGLHLFLQKPYLQTIAKADSQICWRYCILKKEDEILCYTPLQFFDVNPTTSIQSFSNQPSTAFFTRLRNQLIRIIVFLYQYPSTLLWK